MKYAVVTIRKKGSYQFEGQSKGYTGCFHIDSGFFLRKASTLEPDFYKEVCEKDIESLDMDPYKTFFNRLILLS